MNSAIVIDIEGTVGSIAFVRSVLFPYAKRKLPDWVRQHADQPEAFVAAAQRVLHAEAA